MKLVIWDDDCVPPVNVLPNGDGVVADCRYWWNLEIGDMVQYRAEIGTTSCYFVIDKQPATPDSGLGEGVFNVVLRGA